MEKGKREEKNIQQFHVNLFVPHTFTLTTLLLGILFNEYRDVSGREYIQY